MVDRSVFRPDQLERAQAYCVANPGLLTGFLIGNC